MVKVPVWVQRPEYLRGHWFMPWSMKAQVPAALMFNGRRRWMFQLKKTENWPSLHFFILFRPSTDWRMPTRTGEGVFFSQSTDSNGNLFQKYPERHTQKWNLISYLGIPWPCLVDTKLTITVAYLLFGWGSSLHEFHLGNEAKMQWSYNIVM